MKTMLIRLGLGLLGCVTAAAATPTANADKTQELVAILQSNAELAQRARACEQLTIFGTEAAVPALAALLADEKLSHYAREALEAMPHPAAAAALRNALGNLKGDLLIGVVNSLGMRRDITAVARLTKLAADGTAGVAAASILALGRIATPESVPVLQRIVGASTEAALRTAAAEACLLIADDHLVKGRRDSAIVIYDFVRAAKAPGPLRVTATHGALLARGAAGMPFLLEQLRSADIAFRDIALRATREIATPEVTAALIAELDHAAPTLQALIIFALVERGDVRALPAIERSATSTAEDVRFSALKALGWVGGNSSVPVLLHAIRSPASAADGDTALASLIRIKATDADAIIVKSLASADPAVRAKLIGVLGERRAEGAIAELLALAKSSAPEISRAALRALALVSRPADQLALIQLALAMPDEELKTLADRAVASAAMKVLEVARRADVALAAFRQASDPNAKISLLRPLGAIVRSMGTSHEAYLVVSTALLERTEAVRDAALRALTDWPDAAPSVTLLEFAARSDAPLAQREVALQGALRMASNVAAGRDRSPLDLVRFFREANRLVRSKAEKLMIVSGLGSLKRFEAVELLRPYLDDPEVQTEAAFAVVQIAPALLKAPHGDEVKGLLEKIAATEKDEDTKRKAGRVAKGLPIGAGKQKSAAAPAPAVAATKVGPSPLFNGTDLSNWEGNPGVWRVRGGVIVGGSMDGNPRNEFLATTRAYRNFVLKLEYKLIGTDGFINGGVQFRSVRVQVPPNEMSGYQADIGAGHSGSLYDESRRKAFLARAADGQAKRLEKAGDWNRYEIRCQGPHIELWLNGEKTVSYDETDSTLSSDGLIALQIHGNCKAEIAFRDLTVEESP
jgi:HEAT repeat protein